MCYIYKVEVTSNYLTSFVNYFFIKSDDYLFLNSYLFMKLSKSKLLLYTLAFAKLT